MENLEMIPYGRQWVDEDDIAAVVAVLRSDFLTTGPRVQQFERQIAEYVGAKYAVALSSGTAALHAAAFAAGFGPGDEVITTPLTFVATANCVLYRGASPVFADIDPRTYNLDPSKLASKINARTRAVIPIHFAGQPCDLAAIHKLAQEHNLIIIEDAAHALGAEYRGRPIGGLSDLTIFSFHPVKQITTGEGGIVATNSAELYEKVLSFRNHGLTREPERWTEGVGSRSAETLDNWYYEVQLLGYNYRLSDLHAALGLSQLGKADLFLSRRQQIARIYSEALEGLPGLIIPWQQPDSRSSWHLYVVQIEAERAVISRDQFYTGLRTLKIGANLHYIPVYRHPLYKRLGFDPHDYPIMENYYRQALTIPLYPAMTDCEIERVITAIKQLLQP